MAYGYFYKDKYLIAIYNKDDYPVAVFDNPRDMAVHTGKSLIAVQCLISVHLREHWDDIWFNKERCKLHLIELSEEDKQEILLKGGGRYD